MKQKKNHLFILHFTKFKSQSQRSLWNWHSCIEEEPHGENEQVVCIMLPFKLLNALVKHSFAQSVIESFIISSIVNCVFFWIKWHSFKRMNLLNSPAYLPLQKRNALFVKVMWIDKVNKIDAEQVSVLYWKTVWSALSSSLVHEAMTDKRNKHILLICTGLCDVGITTATSSCDVSYNKTVLHASGKCIALFRHFGMKNARLVE